MGRTKVTKRKKGSHTAEDMLRAMMLNRRGWSMRKAAKECNVYYPTLQRYIAKNTAIRTEHLKSQRLTPNYNVNKVFSDEQERILIEYIKECSLKFYGLSTKDVRRVAYQMAAINNIKVPDCWNREKMAGQEWLRSFRSRTPDICLKKPEACSLARATAFNKHTVQSFFTNLKRAMDRHESFGNGCRVYNLDETATTTVQKPQKVLAPKGRQNICKITSGEKGTLVTTCAIVCASGQCLPPVLIFPRKNFKDYMLTGAPTGALGLAYPTGWMNAELFLEVMKHFIKHTSASPENPALLLMDNHESHLSIEALDLAKQSGVTVLTLHPHTTAKMQPLDVGLYGPFKVFYNSAIDSWLMRNPGKQMTIYNVAECVGQAYVKSMTPINITSAFRKCGIFPFDANIFTDIDFMPSEVTDRQISEKSSQQLDQKENVASPLSDATYVGSPNLFETGPFERDAESPSILETMTAEPTFMSVSEPQEPTNPYLRDDVKTPEPNKYSCLNFELTNNNFISPKEFMPALKIDRPRAGVRKPRKLGKSMIATDTPEKNQIDNEKKKAKERKSGAKNMKRPKIYGKKVKVVKQKRKIAKLDSETSEDGETIISLSDRENSDIEDEEDEDFIMINGNFEKLKRKPQENDYVLVLFKTKKIKIFYVGIIIEKMDETTYVASFMRVKSKLIMKFCMPLEPDLAEIKIDDIKMILPLPKINGTKSRNSFYIFPVRMSPNLNLR